MAMLSHDAAFNLIYSLNLVSNMACHEARMIYGLFQKGIVTAFKAMGLVSCRRKANSNRRN